MRSSSKKRLTRSPRRLWHVNGAKCCRPMASDLLRRSRQYAGMIAITGAAGFIGSILRIGSRKWDSICLIDGPLPQRKAANWAGLPRSSLLRHRCHVHGRSPQSEPTDRGNLGGASDRRFRVSPGSVEGPRVQALELVTGIVARPSGRTANGSRTVSAVLITTRNVDNLRRRSMRGHHPVSCFACHQQLVCLTNRMRGRHRRCHGRRSAAIPPALDEKQKAQATFSFDSRSGSTGTGFLESARGCRSRS